MSANERDGEQEGNESFDKALRIKAIIGQIHAFYNFSTDCFINFGTFAVRIIANGVNDEELVTFLDSRSNDELITASVGSAIPMNIAVSSINDLSSAVNSTDQDEERNRVIELLRGQIDDFHAKGVSCYLDFDTGQESIPLNTEKTEIDRILEEYSLYELSQISITPDIGEGHFLDDDEVISTNNDPITQFFNKKPPEEWTNLKGLLHALLVFKEKLEENGASSFSLENAILEFLSRIPNTIDENYAREMIVPFLNAGDLGSVPCEAGYCLERSWHKALLQQHSDPHELERRKNYGEFTQRTGGIPPQPLFITSFVVLEETVGRWGVDGLRTYIAALPKNIDGDDVSYNVLTEMNRYGSTLEIRTMGWNALSSRAKKQSTT